LHVVCHATPPCRPWPRMSALAVHGPALVTAATVVGVDAIGELSAMQEGVVVPRPSASGYGASTPRRGHAGGVDARRRRCALRVQVGVDMFGGTLATMAGLREEAEALAIALEIGGVDVPYAVAWADAQIAAAEHPHWSLCEVATAGRRYPQDVAGLLRNVPGHAEPAVARSLVVQLLAAHFDLRRAYQLASCLYQLAIAGDIDDPELKAIALWAWDGMDLADAGMILETSRDIAEQMRARLEAASEALRSRGPPWSALTGPG
jgi:hypothetical protein